MGKSPEQLALIADHLPGELASFANASLPRGQRFFWRVDSLMGPRLEEGILWSFDTATTGLLAPSRDPRPLHLGRVRPGPVRLTARSVSGAVQYHFYAGTEFPLTAIGSASTPSLIMPGVSSGERWRWRIDVEGPGGVRQGFVWTFRVR